MQDVIFEDAWRRDDPRLAEDAKAFWADLGLVAPAERERRVTELCTVAYHGGKVVGLSTASLGMVPQVRARCAIYRCAISPTFRRQDLSYRISGHSRRVIEDWAREHPEEKVIGMAAVIQAVEYRDKQLEPTWPEHGLHLNLVAYNERGQQLRIAWFPDARLEPFTP